MWPGVQRWQGGHLFRWGVAGDSWNDWEGLRSAGLSVYNSKSPEKGWDSTGMVTVLLSRQPSSKAKLCRLDP